MIDEIKLLIYSNTEKLEDIITDYLQPTASDTPFSFQQKVHAFGDENSLSNLEKAKFKVYLKINKELSNCENSDKACKNSLNFYYPFLINLYAKDESIASNQEKFKFAIRNFVKDIQDVTKKYIESPIDYQKHGTKVS